MVTWDNVVYNRKRICGIGNCKELHHRLLYYTKIEVIIPLVKIREWYQRKKSYSYSVNMRKNCASPEEKSKAPSEHDQNECYTYLVAANPGTMDNPSLLEKWYEKDKSECIIG